MKKGLILGMLMTAASLQAAPNISIHWEMIQNDVEPGVCLTRWTFTNDGTTPLPVSGWTMYYCQISVNPQYKQGDPLHFERISASSHKITPTQAFAGLGVGQSLTLDVRFSGAILKEGAGPEGAFLVIEDSVSKPVRQKTRLLRQVHQLQAVEPRHRELVQICRRRVAVRQVQGLCR